MRQASALPQLALALISLAVFALVPLSLAYTLAQCGFQEDALNAIANLGGMVMSFLGGAWAPLSLMGPGVQAMARFTPSHLLDVQRHHGGTGSAGHHS